MAKRNENEVGAAVVNEANETVATIDDLIIAPADKVPFAVLSVGGFLGVASQDAVVLARALEVNGKKILLRGAATISLKALPTYTYTN